MARGAPPHAPPQSTRSALTCLHAAMWGQPGVQWCCGGVVGSAVPCGCPWPGGEKRLCAKHKKSPLARVSTAGPHHQFTAPSQPALGGCGKGSICAMLILFFRFRHLISSVNNGANLCQATNVPRAHTLGLCMCCQPLLLCHAMGWVFKCTPLPTS